MTDATPCLGEIDVVVLAGGLGTRIQGALGDTPKILAPIGDRTFLDILLSRLSHFGAKRVVLGLGHLGKKVVAHLEDRKRDYKPGGLKIVTAIEPSPLGTAGALRFLAPRFKSDPVMIMNGDSFTGADLCKFLARHRASKAEASILTARVKSTAQYGRLKISRQKKIEEFLEKDAGQTGPGVINAGVYLFNASMLTRIAAMGGASLEKDVFQALPAATLGAISGTGPFIDIGTPADLARAPKVLKPYF